MSHAITPDYNQIFMFPPTIEEWVPANHPARFLRVVVDSLDLEQMGFRISRGIDGRPHYDEGLLLKIWLYGYCNRIRSVRGLEKACMENLSLIWLTGNNTPDHNTLWRFYRDNKKAIRGVFKQSLRIAIEANLVGFALHAVDGTKIQSATTRRTALSRKFLDKNLKHLDEEIAELEKNVETSEEEDRDASWTLPENFSDTNTLRDAVKTALAVLDAEGVDKLSVVDPEARMMKTQDGKRMAYNAQAVADDTSGMIVATEVTNEANDVHQLSPMLKETTRMLNGRKAEENLADAGYDCPEQIANATDAGYEVILPLAAEKGNEFHTVNFKRDTETGSVICPMGKTLKFERTRKSKSGNCELQVYRCKHGAQCPRAAECTKDKRGRSLELSPWHEHTQAQLAKQKDPGKRCKLKQRCIIIEPVFAHIKEHLGFRRFTVHGLENAKTQWSLVCTAYNLKKLYTHWLCGNLKIVLGTT